MILVMPIFIEVREKYGKLAKISAKVGIEWHKSFMRFVGDDNRVFIAPGRTRKSK
ncbi:hypothetical protein FD38_GL001651 [Levilactobacillus zymae DSM 19395]|nr:hypothetical protein FD38_GL001651 [Levilactobacillus zymae DSM 19395]